MIKPQDVYKPLYTNKDKFITLITGGRGSGKSFNASTFIERLTFQEGHVILYVRYTMTSANISIIPEFIEKIEIDGTEKYFETTKMDIINNVSGSKILFRGIKASSGNQTAKLKSIQGVTTFVCDEAEEWVSEVDYEKIMLSIRQKGIQNRVIIIMNPSDVNHFIYKKYIEKTHKIISIDGVDVQISTHPNVLHIHTTYLDNIENLGTEFLDEMKRIKETEPKKYEHIVIGRWADIAEGVIFKKIEIVDEIPHWVKKRGYGMDFGYTQDPTAIIDCAIFENDLYLDEICYKTRMLTGDIVSELKAKPQKVISESADPRLIQEISNAGVLIYPVEKFQGSILAGINKMLEMNIKVTKRSYNLLNEFRNYTWDKDKDGNYINQPIDKFNHGIDAARYWILGEVLGKILSPKNVSKEDLGLF
ncbi:PBSX family phage terminase large subunit [Bacteroidia bacterium]|nr:PBSX family phage terminase large subunit [Bacteroidia bacterium]